MISPLSCKFNPVPGPRLRGVMDAPAAGKAGKLGSDPGSPSALWLAASIYWRLSKLGSERPPWPVESQVHQAPVRRDGGGMTFAFCLRRCGIPVGAPEPVGRCQSPCSGHRVGEQLVVGQCHARGLLFSFPFPPDNAAAGQDRHCGLSDVRHLKPEGNHSTLSASVPLSGLSSS